MPCEKTGSTIICYAHGYRFKGYHFELLRGEPIPLKKNGDPSKRIPWGFWKAMEEFLALPDAEREQYLA
jgi:hypothetical protein